MKLLRHLIASVCIFAATAAGADDRAIHSYGTAREIAAMTPCMGTLIGRSPCSSHFTTADGKYFGIGNPGSGAVVSHFIWSLKDGQSCKFPDTFLEYQKQNPDKKQ